MLLTVQFTFWRKGRPAGEMFGHEDYKGSCDIARAQARVSNGVSNAPMISVNEADDGNDLLQHD